MCVIILSSLKCSSRAMPSYEAIKLQKLTNRITEVNNRITEVLLVDL